MARKSSTEPTETSVQFVPILTAPDTAVVTHQLEVTIREGDVIGAPEPGGPGSLQWNPSVLT